ncbi:hypothetical protein [Tenacibaculum halocynthiae]|uniref:hypothetical protein n=1 Tax=Tenacibaculum halocynthiae TaxID=1254437 RepID=UPI0038947625
MILRGILDRSLSNQLCIRGFAPLGELARLSKADYTYQRDLISKQETTIKQFLKHSPHLFFPEVILGHHVEYDYSLPKAQKGLQPINIIESGSKFESNIQKIKFSSKKLSYKDKYDSRNKAEVQVVEIEIDEDYLLECIEKKAQPFSRIDGNHRLSAVSDKKGDEEIKKRDTPFCIVLFQSTLSEITDRDGNKKKVVDNNGEKFEKVVFHNINTKSVPLTSEENLRVIVEDEKNFKNEALKKEFGWKYVAIRSLNKLLPSEHLEDIFPNLHNAFLSFKDNTPYKLSVISKIIDFLLKENGLSQTNESIKQIKASLKKVNQEFGNHDLLKKSKNSSFLIAALSIELNTKKQLKHFVQWVSKHELAELNEVSAKSLLDIYLKIYTKSIDVFVAMKYYGVDEVASYNSIYSRAVARIKKENPDINIKLLKIMTHNGATKNIISKMIKEIENCSIFIADVTERNPNVAYELGYARSMNKPTIIVQKHDDPTEIPFDYAQDFRKTYNIGAPDSLENLAYDDIKAILETNYGFKLN